MRSSTIEPGLLRVFHWYVGIRLGLLVLVLWANQQDPDPTNPRFPEVGLFLFGILFVLLISPFAQRKLGRAFLPVALILASIAPLAESIATIEGRLDAGLGVNQALEDFWIPFFLLFVPLLMIAWQYRYRSVLFFAIATTLLDLGAIIPIVEGRNADVASLTGLVAARGFLFAFVGLFVVKLVSAQKEARRSLASHSTTLEHLATSRERNRLARELHDTLAHSLSGIAVQLEAVKALWTEEPDRAHGMLDQALSTARGGLGEARRAIQDLRASPLEELGLVAALHQLKESLEDGSGIEIDMQIADNLGDIAPELENVLYRIVDESLTNVIRHSNSQATAVELKRGGGRILLRVSDSGDGFEPLAVPEGHLGIKGMRERAEMVNGSLSVVSAIGRGTTIAFEVSPWK